jgi:hypothetical protein
VNFLKLIQIEGFDPLIHPYNKSLYLNKPGIFFDLRIDFSLSLKNIFVLFAKY